MNIQEKGCIFIQLFIQKIKNVNNMKISSRKVLVSLGIFLSFITIGEISAKPKPLIIIDGKVEKVDLKTINPANIESMNVLKGENAILKYGRKAKNGAIEIQTKPSTK